MGDIVRAGRAGRFINEFNKDWIRSQGYRFHNIITQGLGYDEYSQGVRHYITLKEIGGDETLLMGEKIIFGPEDDDMETLAEYLAEWLGGTREEIVERLKKANLWGD